MSSNLVWKIKFFYDQSFKTSSNTAMCSLSCFSFDGGSLDWAQAAPKERSDKTQFNANIIKVKAAETFIRIFFFFTDLLTLTNFQQ